jgi:hypothetical protein
MVGWLHSVSRQAQESTKRIRRVIANALPFRGELEKIATTFDFVEIPEGFYNTSAPIFARLSELIGSANPYLADVLFPLLLCKQDVKIG